MIPGISLDRLLSKRDVAKRAQLSERRIEVLAAMPDCPLKFVQPRHGVRKVCTPQNLERFLFWLIDEPRPQAG